MYIDMHATVAGLGNGQMQKRIAVLGKSLYCLALFLKQGIALKASSLVAFLLQETIGNIAWNAGKRGGRSTANQQ